jgi:quercetin dioxygenase-like cupin family protein
MSESIVRGGDAMRAVEMVPGVVRRTLASGDNLTLCQFDLAAGAVVPEHTHPHEQAGTVASGRILLRVGGDSAPEREVAPGGAYLIPGGAPHLVRAIEVSRLIEVFAPVREEFAHDYD